MLEIEYEQNTLVLKVSGRIDGSNAGDFQTKIQELIPEDANSAVLDLNDLAYISSAGLRVILLLAKNMKKRQGKLGMCAVTGPIKDVFTISGFHNIIPIYNDRPSAIEAVS